MVEPGETGSDLQVLVGLGVGQVHEDRMIAVPTQAPVRDGLGQGVLVHDGAEVVQNGGGPGGVEMPLWGSGEPQAQGDTIREGVAGLVRPEVVDLVGDQQVVEIPCLNPRAQATLEWVTLKGRVGGDDDERLIQPGAQALVALL